MSLVKKIKDILFEEEPTEQIKIVKETPTERKKEEVSIREYEPIKEEYKEPTIEPRPRMDTRIDNRVDTRMEPRVETPLKREPIQDNSFKFPDFDEEEFISSMPRRQSTSNVLEYERKKVQEQRNSYKYDRSESKELIEKKKFKPSPIISPVYGVLNQDYKPEDIKKKEDNEELLSIDVVRKKAFETKPIKEEVEEIKIEDEEFIDTIDEPVVKFFDEKNNDTEMKSIDDLLENASDTVVKLDDELEITTDTNIDAIHEELENYEPSIEKKDKLEDTLENDLFELIDSMYETKEGGE